jgi:hypothetical protein
MRQRKAGQQAKPLSLVPRRGASSHGLVPRLIRENQRLMAFVPLSQTLVTWDMGQDQGPPPHDH